jgi:hypothetical protein
MAFPYIQMPAQTHRALTDVKIRQTKADVNSLKLTDANGLYLKVKVNGEKLSRYRYKIAKIENLFAMGEYPALSLAEARKEPQKIADKF